MFLYFFYVLWLTKKDFTTHFKNHLEALLQSQKITWKKKQRDTEEEEDYDPVPCEISENKIMFVYQSHEMRRLYKRCAPILVLLDATYRTTKYSLPLYFLVVQTNVNYQVAAVIVCLEEKTEMITEALRQIKGK